jgi:hypothetical protein
MPSDFRSENVSGDVYVSGSDIVGVNKDRPGFEPFRGPVRDIEVVRPGWDGQSSRSVPSQIPCGSRIVIRCMIR